MKRAGIVARHVEAVGISHPDRRVTTTNKEAAEGASLRGWPQRMSIAIVGAVPAAVTNERAVDSVERTVGGTESEESLEKVGSIKAGKTTVGQPEEEGYEANGRLRRWQAVVERLVQATNEPRARTKDRHQQEADESTAKETGAATATTTGTEAERTRPDASLERDHEVPLAVEEEQRRLETTSLGTTAAEAAETGPQAEVETIIITGTTIIINITRERGGTCEREQVERISKSVSQSDIQQTTTRHQKI